MLKQIPKSDINLRPFKVYKSWTATEATEWVKRLVAQDRMNEKWDEFTDEEKKENGLFHQLKVMYYNGDNALNPFMSYGTFKPRYTSVETAKQRSLLERAIVLTIPQIKFGEEIKPTSVTLYDGNLNENIVDDGYGNLFSNYSSYTFIQIDVENSKFVFYDAENNIITTTLLYIELEAGIMLVQNEDEFYLLTVDVESSTISFLGIFVNTDLSIPIVGNVIYQHGIIVLTKETQIGEVRENSLTEYNLSFKSTNTIYENEYLIIVGEDEFNVSTNPTAVTEVNGSLEQLDEFSNYEYSSSIDPIGSYLAPYITTIGLYDENMDMIAVAKLAKPIKSTPDLPVNFLVRIDT